MAQKEEEMTVDQEELLDENQGEEQENPDLEFDNQEEEDQFEIVSEDEVDSSEEEEQESQTKQQIDALQQQLQQIQQQSQEKEETSKKQQNDEKMDQLAQILREMKQESSKKDQNQNQQQVDWKQKRSKWQENIWDDPLSTLDDYTQSTVGPVVNQLQGEISRLKKQVAKQNAKSDPRYKEIMEKYGDEVEEIAKNYEGDENAYEKAASFAAMRHFDEIVSEKAKQMAQEESQEQEGKKQADTKQKSYTGVTEQPNPTQKKKNKNRVVLKPGEKQEFERRFALSVFDNRRDFYNRVWLRDRSRQQ